MMNVFNIGWVKNIWITIRNFQKILFPAKNSLPLIKLVFRPTWTKKASNWGIICSVKNMLKFFCLKIFAKILNWLSQKFPDFRKNSDAKIFAKFSTLKISSVIFIFSDTIDSVKKVCEEDLKTAKSKINESAWCKNF